MQCKVDGSRRRRHADPAQKQWYARHRARRYARYIWGQAQRKWANQILGRSDAA